MTATLPVPPLPSNPATVVQAQLDAYNAHDIVALLAIYADDAQQFQHPTTLIASGTQQLRARFTARFEQARPHATLHHRIVIGNTVTDHETVSSMNGTDGAGGDIAMLATYEVVDGRIARAWFLSAQA